MSFPYRNQSFSQRIKQLYTSQPVIMRLIAINLVIWLLLNLVQVADFLFYNSSKGEEFLWVGRLIKILSVPASITSLLKYPWTIFTYMFVQYSFWHLFFNMLWLYWFGKIFLEFKNSKQLIYTYIAGGVVGAIVFVGAYNIFPVFQSSIAISTAIGASASILAITVATAVLVPDYSIMLFLIGKIKVKHIAIAVIVFDILLIPKGNAGGHFAHLGGALCGLIYGIILKNENPKGKRIKFRPVKKKAVKKPVERVKSDEEFNMEKAKHQQKIDEILDKISKKGYSNLTTEEKDYLFNSSKK